LGNDPQKVLDQHDVGTYTMYSGEGGMAQLTKFLRSVVGCETK